MLDLKKIKHEKENAYELIGKIMCGFMAVYILVLLLILTFAATIGVLILFLVLVAAVGIVFFLKWFFHNLFRANLYNNSLKLSEKQFPETFKEVENGCKLLGIKDIPEVFLVNGNGVVNAFAYNFLSKKYVILYSELVDTMLERGKHDELKMVISHELAHHALGHTKFWKNYILEFGLRMIPGLSFAYSRAMELSADRVGMIITGNSESAKRGIVSTVIGSKALASHIDIKELKEQEYCVDALFGFLSKFFSTHPTLVKRVIEMEKFANK